MASIDENRLSVAQPENALILRQSDLTGRRSLDLDCVIIVRSDNILHCLFCYETHGSKTTSTRYGPHLAGINLKLLFFHSLSLSFLTWCFRARINIRIGSSCIRWVSLFLYYNPFYPYPFHWFFAFCAGTQFRHTLFSIYSLHFILFWNWGTFACALPRDLIIQLLLRSQPQPPPCEVPFAGRLCLIGYVDHCILIEPYTQGFICRPVCGYLLWSPSVGPLWSLHPHPTRQHPPTFLGFVSRSVHRSLRPSY